jgi:carboxylate-amine ligase
MLENGTGADRQLAVFEKTKNLVDVAKYINSQYLMGV